MPGSPSRKEHKDLEELTAGTVRVTVRTASRQPASCIGSSFSLFFADNRIPLRKGRPKRCALSIPRGAYVAAYSHH